MQHTGSSWQHAGSFSCGCGHVSRPGINPGPLHWERRVLPTGPPGKSPLLDCFIPDVSRERASAIDTCWVCSALLPSSSFLTFYFLSQAHNPRHHLKQQYLSPFPLVCLYKPATEISPIAMPILLQNFKCTQHLSRLPLIERNIFCYPVNLPY